MSSFKVENTADLPLVLADIPTQGSLPTNGVFTNPQISVDNEGRIRTIEEGSGGGSASAALPLGSLQYHDPASAGDLKGESFLTFNSMGNSELILNPTNSQLPNAFAQNPGDSFINGHHLTLGCDQGRRIDFNRNNSGAAADCSWAEGLQIRNNVPGTFQTIATSLVDPVISVDSDHSSTTSSKLRFFKDTSNPNTAPGYTAGGRPTLNTVPSSGDPVQNAAAINNIIDLLQTYGLAL